MCVCIVEEGFFVAGARETNWPVKRKGSRDRLKQSRVRNARAAPVWRKESAAAVFAHTRTHAHISVL